MVEELFAKMTGADRAGVVRENNIKSDKKKKSQDLWEYMFHPALQEL